MAVVSSDIKYYLSGGAANTDPDAALGGKVSTTEVVFSPDLNNLFDDVTADQALAGAVEYRCLYVFNGHATDGLSSGKMWISANTPSAGTEIAIGLDPAGVGDGDTTGEAATIADEETAPVGVTFSSPSTEGASLAIAAMAAQEGFALWVRRTVTTDTEAASDDPFTLTFKGTPV